MFAFWRNKPTNLAEKPFTPQVATDLLIGEGVNLDNPTKIQQICVSETDRRRGMLVVGTTGVGKTRLEENFVTHDILTGKSVVVIDPKGDQGLFNKIYDTARGAGRLEELQLITPVFPEHSAIIDPMSYFFMIDELVGHITAAIPPSKEPFYRDIAKEVSTAVITAEIIIAKYEGRMPKLNLDHIRQCIRRKSLEDTRTTLAGITAPDSLRVEAERVAGMITDILESSVEHFTKVSMSLRTALMTLSSGNIGKIIGQAESNKFIHQLEQGKRVILVVHTGAMVSPDASQTLGRVLVSMIQGYIGRVYNSARQKIEPALAVHIDEAQNVAYQGIENLTAMGGSANVMTTYYVQDFCQLKDKLGDNLAQVVLNTCNTKIFLRCPDAETSEYVVRHFGTKQVLTGIFGANNVTTREVEQEAVKVYDVLSLQNQDFLMLSYSGRWKGKTAFCPDSNVKIIFPDTPTLVDAAAAEEEVA